MHGGQRLGPSENRSPENRFKYWTFPACRYRPGYLSRSLYMDILKALLLDMACRMRQRNQERRPDYLPLCQITI